MYPSFAITPAQHKASQALLRGQLAQLEETLLEARERVLLSFDRELASLRGWMDSLEHFDPTVGLHALREPDLAPLGQSLEELIAKPPHTAPCNVVPFSVLGGNMETTIEEQPLDPAFANATIDELNAALAAAFKHMAQEAPLQEARSA